MWEHGGIGSGPTIRLYQSTIATTPEDAFERVPTARSDGQIHLVADVRLDNRQEIADLCGVDIPGPGVSDAALILAAYDRWGVDCPGYLDGDFAFILWDQSRELMLAARDLFGVRPLLFSSDRDGVVVASTIKGVLSGLRETPAFNLDFLRAFANGSSIPEPATSYASINWVAPGHRLVVTRHDCRHTRYGELRPRLPERGCEAVFEEFRALLTGALERRLRSSTPIGFMLSGGFDSSALVLLADRAVASGRSGAMLRSYSAVFDRIREGDERAYLQAVLERCPQVVPTLINSDHELWSLDTLGSADGFELEEPPNGNRFNSCVSGKPAVADGCRVVIHGGWADELLIRFPHWTGALFWGLPLSGMRREWRYFLTKKPRLLARSSLPALWRGGQSWAARLGLAPGPSPLVGSILKKRFASSWVQLASAGRLGRWIGAELRAPFLDRRLHEFVAGLPPEYLLWEGRGKRLLRESLADLFPPEFQARSTHPYVTQLVVEGMTRELPRIRSLLASPMVVELGLVTPRRLARIVRALDERDDRRLNAVGRVLAVEVWLRERLLEPTQHAKL